MLRIVRRAVRRVRMKSRRITSVAVAIAAVVMFSATGTFAYLKYKTDVIENKFKNGVVNITVNEEFTPEEITEEGVTKKVVIKNDSLDGKLNVCECYVRVNLVATWVNDDGTISPINADELIEYTINSSPDSGWTLRDDGFYYYSRLLKKDESTTHLLEKVSLKEGVTKPATGHLEINVLADAFSEDGIEKINKN